MSNYQRNDQPQKNTKVTFSIFLMFNNKIQSDISRNPKSIKAQSTSFAKIKYTEKSTLMFLIRI